VHLTRISRQDEKRSSIIPAEKVHQPNPFPLGVISQPARFFQIGRVFKMLWTEPAGEDSCRYRQGVLPPSGYGQLSFHKKRRFVVVRKRLHSCLCLAISTYGVKELPRRTPVPGHTAVLFVKRLSTARTSGLLRSLSRSSSRKPSETIDPKSMIDFGRGLHCGT